MKPIVRIAAALVLLLAAAVHAQKVDAVVREQDGSKKDAQASQQRIDQLADQTQDMLGKYRQALSDAESFKKYNEQLAVQVVDENQNLSHFPCLPCQMSFWPTRYSATFAPPSPSSSTR